MAVKGVTMAGKHSYHDWGLFFKQAPSISPPEPKTHYVDIPGADGALDLTETLTGGVKYKNRKITLVFIREATPAAWKVIYKSILETVHGKRVAVKFDSDPFCTYTGRVTVAAPEWANRCVTLKMEIEADPYKLANAGGTEL